jgi:hypothetical protein
LGGLVGWLHPTIRMDCSLGGTEAFGQGRGRFHTQLWATEQYLHGVLLFKLLAGG